MDDFDEFENDLLNYLNDSEGIVNKTKEYTIDEKKYCCSVKMEEYENYLVCHNCGNTEEVFDDTNGSENCSVIYTTGRKEFVLYSKTNIKSNEERIADINNIFKTIMEKKNFTINQNILWTASNNLYLITKNKHTIKSNNRISTFAYLLYLSSIQHKEILLQSEIRELLGKKIKYSSGLNIITSAIFDERIDLNLDIDDELYPLLIIKYLNAFNINFNNPNKPFKNFNNDLSRKKCCLMIEIMLNNNLAYDSCLISKCLGIIYYLIIKKYSQFIEPKPKDIRAYFKTIVDVSEDSYIKVYNLLISSDVKRFFELV